MVKVERENPPRRWSEWSATRDQFASIAQDIAGVVQRECGEETSNSITVPGYERTFDDASEMLENVGEREWVGLVGSAIATSYAGRFPDMLTVSFHLEQGHSAGVWLFVRGGRRGVRNAIEPDLVALVERHVRTPKRPWPNWAGTALQLGIQPVLIIGFIALVLRIPDLGPAGVVIASVPAALAATLVTFFVSPRVDRLMKTFNEPGIELLADDGRSAASKARARAGPRARLAGAIMVGLASIVAAVAGVIAVLR